MSDTEAPSERQDIPVFCLRNLRYLRKYLNMRNI